VQENCGGPQSYRPGSVHRPMTGHSSPGSATGVNPDAANQPTRPATPGASSGTANTHSRPYSRAAAVNASRSARPTPARRAAGSTTTA
jgi:hypothetical protein